MSTDTLTRHPIENMTVTLGEDIPVLLKSPPRIDSLPRGIPLMRDFQGEAVSDQNKAQEIALILFEHMIDWPCRSAAAFRDIFLMQKVRLINPLLNINHHEDADFLFGLMTETVLAGRMIDFGHLPNDVIKDMGAANRDAFEAGEFMHPYDTWIGVHRWEGGFSGYLFTPQPGNETPTTIAIEMYALSIPGTRGDLDGAVIFYDIVFVQPRAPGDTRCWAFPMRGEGVRIPEGGRVANSLDPLVTMLRLLADASVPVIPHPEPVKLNRHRLAQGKPPIPAYTEVQTASYITAWRAAGSARKPAQGGHHASPVAHTRRAHTRLLASGRVVPVRSSKVNWRDHEEVRRMFYKVTL